MDLSLDVGDYKLNIRAAGVIIHNNKILIHKNVNEDHCCIPGGRIEIGENSKETIKREIKEEMGKEVEVKRYLATIENFFEFRGKKSRLLPPRIWALMTLSVTQSALESAS